MSRKLLPLAAFAALFMFCSVFLTADIPQCMAAPEWALAAPQTWLDEVNLIARLIMGEATGEPLAGQVAVGAVILNRVRSPEFPNTVAGVVYDPWAFESVENGLIWSREPTPENIRAAELALNGWDHWGLVFLESFETREPLDMDARLSFKSGLVFGVKLRRIGHGFEAERVALWITAAIAIAALIFGVTQFRQVKSSKSWARYQDSGRSSTCCPTWRTWRETWPRHGPHPRLPSAVRS